MSSQTPALPRPELSAAKRALLDARLRGHNRAQTINRARGGEAPLSFAQERLWFLDRLQPGSAIYNMPTALRLEGMLDAAALERALGEVVRRHDALRTTFVERDGAPVQLIAPFHGFALPVEDLSHRPRAERDVEAGRLAREEAARPFDLATGPPVRVRLLRLHEREHVLLLTLHHIVSDGWSMGVLFREVSVLYGACRAGRPSPLPELPVQYADYAIWQREQLQGEALERQLAYWRAHLTGMPALLALPADRPRPAVQSFGGACTRVVFPRPLLDRLRALGRGEGVTLYMVLLAAFQVLLARYSGSDDVVVGSPIAGRARREVEGVVGFFVNTLVLRTGLSGDPSFREVLRRVREVTLGAFEHQEVPFEKLVAELQPERSLSHSPLFQALFVLHESGRTGLALPGLTVRGVDAEIDRTEFDLVVQLTETPRGLVGELIYNTDLFERSTIRRLGGHLVRVLEQAADDPDVRLSALELMRAEERAQVLDAWNQTDAAYPAERCLHGRFETQAAAAPGAVAVACGGEALTYRELNARANQLARHLRGIGVAPERRVAIYLERGPDMVVAMLAVLKAGGAYVPLDPGAPVERVALMVADASAAVLVTREALRGRIAARTRAAVVSVDGAAEEIARQRADDLVSATEPRSLAYVIYTSGSTGTPKGVAVEHRGVCSMCTWHARAFGITSTDRATQLASPGFDAVVWEVWPYLLQGASVHVVPDEVRAHPEGLRDWLVRRAITVAWVPTPMAELLMALDWPGATALRWLQTAGDWLKARPRTDHPFRVSNNYGPTECTVLASSGVVEAEGAGAPTIGKPISNVRVYVLDDRLCAQPAGVPGELCIGGIGVARGYLDRPALTAEPFVPDPFAREPGARLYRTGDRARWRSDGTLEFLGRLDRQVKIRGFRIELGEIESALSAHPGVHDARVSVRQDAPGATRLVAYTVGDADAEELRAHLRRTLPEYMLPAAFVRLEAMPLTPNGKLDAGALPPPDAATVAGARLQRPANHVEVELIHLWEELLGVDVPDPCASFFDLGGNSLLGVRLLSQIQQRLHCDLPVAALYTGATIRQMASTILEQQRSAVPSSPVVPLQRNGSLPTLFCVHPADRGVGVYFNLARHLGRDQPVSGIRDMGEDPSRPVHEIASEHVQALRSVQPRGPYYLLGYSYGGMVAHEMAAQLERQGEPPAFVGLIDAPEPLIARRAPRPAAAAVVAARAAEIAVNMGRPCSLRAEDLEGLSLDDQYRRAVEALRAQGAAPRYLDDAALRKECEMLRGREASVDRYERSGTFSGALTLFRATVVSRDLEEILAPLTAEEQRTLGWCTVSPRSVNVHWIPGSHYTMRMEPHVRVLAERLRDALAAARQRSVVAGLSGDVLQPRPEC